MQRSPRHFAKKVFQRRSTTSPNFFRKMTSDFICLLPRLTLYDICKILNLEKKKAARCAAFVVMIKSESNYFKSFIIFVTFSDELKLENPPLPLDTIPTKLPVLSKTGPPENPGAVPL